MSAYCYNTGCCKEYNATEECVYHSGKPYFHDAYKIWTCCEKKSTDFSTFLSIPGCTKGKHSNIAPKKEEIVEEVKRNEIIEQKLDQLDIDCRALPSIDEPLLPLKMEESSNLVNSGEVTSNAIISGPEEVVMKCSNCGKLEQNTENADNAAECVSHSGVPIFHETLKYWTCCSKYRTSFFDEFEKIKGCVVKPEHNFVKTPKTIKPSVRIDWFQTSSNVTITLFMKNGRKKFSKISANCNRVFASIMSLSNEQLFSKEWQLSDIIDCEKSQVLFAKTKVEIILKKWHPNKHWSDLVAKH